MSEFLTTVGKVTLCFHWVVIFSLWIYMSNGYLLAVVLEQNLEHENIRHRKFGNRRDAIFILSAISNV